MDLGGYRCLGAYGYSVYGCRGHIDIGGCTNIGGI